MASPPPSPKPKGSLGKSLRKKWNKLGEKFTRGGGSRPSPPSPSQQTAGTPATQSRTPSLLPPNQIGLMLTTGTGSSSTSPVVPVSQPSTLLRVPDADPRDSAQSVTNLPAIMISGSPNASTANLGASISPETDATKQPTTSTIWAGLGTALRALQDSAGLFPPLHSAISIFMPCLSVLEDAARNNREYEDLASEIISSSELLARHMKEPGSTRMSEAMSKAASSIEEQAQIIGNKLSRRMGKRVLEASTDDEELTRCYRQIQNLFRRLQADISLDAERMAVEREMNIRLGQLDPAEQANYDSSLSTEINRRTCTENTRKTVLSGLDDWSCDPKAADVYWMSGMAGTGKTTIACSLSKALEDRNQLAASFFCTRTSSECRDVNRIIPTIAYQLARCSVDFRSALCEALVKDPGIKSKAIPVQFDRLLKEPLLKAEETMPDNLVVVIDALDECESSDGTRLILETLFRFAIDLPLKFFVTSRPEPEIYDKIRSGGRSSRAVLHLHDIEASLVQADIEIFLKEELAFMSPTTTQIEELARRSGNLFIFAATLARYIRPVKGSNPWKRLQSVLEMTSRPEQVHARIDELYAAVLKAVIDGGELNDDEIHTMKLVLWTVVCVQEPVDVGTISELAGLGDTREALAALEALRSVIHFSETTGLASTLHASFPDFILSEKRSGALFCDPGAHNQLLARRCFIILQMQLRFNICNLESSFVLDEKVDNLEKRVKATISPALSYACRYWGNHLKLSTHSDTLCTMLREFLSIRLLFWMEVLNLKRVIGLGVEILLKAKLWLSIEIASPEIIRLVEDARNFTLSFAASQASASTPHIYISSMPFCPRSSTVFKHYWKNMRGVIEVTGNAMQRREMAALATWNAGSNAKSAAYSPDGSRIVSAGDRSIRVWNAQDGTLIADPFEGHTDSVSSVAYSPDGTRIVSGSDDRTIRVWNAQDGTPIAGPFEGHSKLVSSVAYSPDGTCIVSGSYDHTIRVWGAQDGTLIAGPFEGHSGSVMSVAYSPDGTRIASGSHDCTVRAWDAQDGKSVATPCEGHTGSVSSVAYSPDGTRIVSGSYDDTIRVWNAQDGTLIAGPFEGHTGLVTSVAYSPDGTRIVSGSDDDTIRVWNAQDGTLIAGPFDGHTHSVFSVAYSPDGTRIVSGSNDRTIRVWNAQDGITIAGSFRGHINSVLSVAYSPDGTRIVSGSHDCTVRAWDAQDGTSITAPFEGHTGSVSSVAYSPDGTRIVSGSHDDTIRVWNVQDGTLVAGPFEGHTGSVTSVVYSPDSTHIASGSSDRTIRVWNAQDGTPIASPFEGHTDLVWSVAYSPDGARIVSGSHDCTIRVWKAQDGTLVAGPFEGHTHSVRSVAYSPDGTRIVSGSFDFTIRVWDAQDGTIIAGPFEGHTDSVWSVAYSPDGARIVSGSEDCTIQVWNAQDGTLIASPFEGHTGPVWSVAYSPDGTRIVSGSDDHTIVVSRVGEHIHSNFLSSGSSSPISSNIATDQTRIFWDGWKKQDTGWVLNQDSTCYFFWVPPDMMKILPTPHHLFVIGRVGVLQVDYSNLYLGNHWHMCYVSA